MFKKLLASVGIGNATVDTRLTDDSLAPGDTVAGEVHMRGGDVAQEIDSIYLYLATRYKREAGDSTVYEEGILVKHPLSQRFTLAAGETKVVPFSFQLPYETPLIVGGQQVYVRTGLEITSAIDPKDVDQIIVQPHPLQQRVFDAVQNLGFQLYAASCKYSRKLGRSYPFVQEFEFKPFGKYSGRLEELELIFYLSATGMEVLLEMDKQRRGFAAFFDDFDLNERYARFTVGQADLERGDWAGMIDQIIEERIRY